MINSELENRVVGYIKENYSPEHQSRLLIALEHLKAQKDAKKMLSDELNKVEK